MRAYVCLLLFALCGCTNCERQDTVVWKTPTFPDDCLGRDEIETLLRTEEGFTRILEARWTPEKIREFCRAGSRANPFVPFLSAPSETDWRHADGVLHADKEEELGELRWWGYGPEQGITDCCLCCKRGADLWLLEHGFVDVEYFLERLDGVALTKRRLGETLWGALHYGRGFDSFGSGREEHKRWAGVLDSKGEEGLVSTADGVWYVWRSEGSPVREVRVLLDGVGDIADICLDGKSDPYANKMYRDWVANYERYVEDYEQRFTK